jgi:hypothetical protein
MLDDTNSVNLYNPSQQAWHRVPNHPAVIQDFQDRGWETPEDSAARAEADAGQLHGQELEEALKAAGLPTGGKVAEKQQRLADFRAEQVPTSEGQAAQADTTTENTESEGSE